MPPTVQTGQRDDHRSRRQGGARGSELVGKVRYNNSLPDIPFDPKFITYPFEPNRFVQYNPTSLERSYKHELLTEHDLGVTIDLINPVTYKIDPNSALAEEDERLLEEDANTPGDAKRSRHHNKNVSWLRKTEYISTEYNRFTPSNEMAESKVGFSIKKYFKEEDLYKDKDSQIQAIEQTFEANKTTISKHYSKPGVTPVEVLPVFPDFEMWRHPCAQVIFDSDPASKGQVGPKSEEMAQAMIRGMVDEAGDQFVAYFLPTEETVGKRKRDREEGLDFMPEEEYDYTLAREYNWNVKNKASKGYEETYFFVFKEDGVYYNELETRVRLSKRRKAGGTGQPSSKSRLIVKHRDQNEPEVAAQDARMQMLEPQIEEDEEEEEELPKNFNEDQAEGEEGEEDKAGSDNELGAGSGDEDGFKSGAESEGKKSDKEDNEDNVSVRSGGSRRSGSVSGSGSGTPVGSGSEKGSGSESEGESDHDEDQKKAAEEIFGSGSSSDED